MTLDNIDIYIGIQLKHLLLINYLKHFKKYLEYIYIFKFVQDETHSHTNEMNCLLIFI